MEQDQRRETDQAIMVKKRKVKYSPTGLVNAALKSMADPKEETNARPVSNPDKR